MELSKTITEFLRTTHDVKASHARELAAAFLGYGTHASYLALAMPRNYELSEVQTLIPDLSLLRKRLTLDNLPPLPGPKDLAKEIADFLIGRRLLRARVVYAETLRELEYEMGPQYLINVVSLEDLLAGEIAISNCWFGYEHYQEFELQKTDNIIKIRASGEFEGKHDDERDRPNHGDRIDFNVEVDLKLVAWNVGFSQEVRADGELRSPY